MFGMKPKLREQLAEVKSGHVRPFELIASESVIRWVADGLLLGVAVNGTDERGMRSLPSRSRGVSDADRVLGCRRQVRYTV